MANTCRTRIKIEASTKAIQNFVERFDKCVDGYYPNTLTDKPHIIDEFGAKAELLIDRIGSKWVSIWDGGIEYHTDTYCEFSLESAWYPPSDMILEMFRQMEEIDGQSEGVRVYGSYWDEGYEPIGVFEVYHGQIIEIENHDLPNEVDWEDEIIIEDYTDRNFWEEVVEPAFLIIQDELDTVMKNI